MAVHINQFFVDVLGAKVANDRWSWGAYDPISNRIYLRIWADLFSKGSDGERVEVLWLTKKRKVKHGFNERVRHIEMIRAGIDGYGVVCTAKNPESLYDREIVSFNKKLPKN